MYELFDSFAFYCILRWPPFRLAPDDSSMVGCHSGVMCQPDEAGYPRCETANAKIKEVVFGRTRITVDSVAGCAHLYCAVHLTTQCIHQLTGCVSVDGRDVTDVTDVRT